MMTGTTPLNADVTVEALPPVDPVHFPVEIPNQRGGCVTMIVDNIMPGGSANG